jgi:hypothetical protein
MAVPVLSSLDVTAGPLAGGTTIHFGGSGFTGTTGVTVGGTAATSFTAVDDTHLTVVTEAHAAGAASVIVTNATGPSVGGGTNTFTYVAVATLTSLDVSTGPGTGATTVHVGGTSFTTTSAVTVGGTAATSFTVVDGTHLTIVTPLHAAGAALIVVTNAGGASSGGVNTFTYIATATVTALDVATISDDGGNTVTLTGTGFATVTSVLFGATAALSFAHVSATVLTAVSPPHATGATHVTVVSPGGTSATGTGNAITYQASGTYTQPDPSTVTDDGTNYFMDVQLSYANVQNGSLQKRFDVWQFPQKGVEVAPKVGS